MAAEWDILATRVVIETGVNDIIRCASNGGAVGSVTVAAGTYYVLGDGADLLTAVETAFNAAHPDISIEAIFTSAPATGNVDIDINLDTATSFRFDPTDTLNTFPLIALGFFEDTGDITSSYLASGYSWCSNQPAVLEDSVSKTRRVNQMTTKGGEVYSFSSGARLTRRRLRFEHVEPARVWASASPTNPGLTFDRYGDSIDGGERFRLYRVVESSSGVLTAPTSGELVATYVLDLGAGYAFEPQRVGGGGPLFSFEFDAIEVAA